MAQYPANIDLANLDGSNGFKLSGAAAHHESGYSVASAGDVNGDGFADLIVGSRGADPHGRDSGASYVVFGKASGFAGNLELSKLNGSNGFKLSGVAAGDLTGSSVASAGDVNGDGLADLIIGARHADPHGTYSGASYVVFGKASGFAANINLSSLDGSTGFKLSGVAADDRTGDSVASAGDVNGDGFADLIVGAFLADTHGDRSGASYVVFGKASEFAANLDLSSLDGNNGFKLSGESAGDRSGNSVASAGDVNGDGLADLIVGAVLASPHGSYSGASYVVFGKASGFAANLDLSSLDGSNGFKLSGVAADDRSGYLVASAGDVNGDGLADLIVGAMGADPHGTYSGASYVVFGKSSGFAGNIDLSSLDGSNGFKLSGVAAWDHSGRSVASAGDVNGDGFDDVIVGAPWADAHGSYNYGASYVVFGKASGFAANIDLSSLDGSNGFKLSGVAGYDESGFSVASAGDVNGDGFGDLIVGAWQADPNGDRSGASYVVYGRAPDTAVNRVGTVASQTLAGGAFDDTLSGLGGDDRLFGHGGSDALDGGTGNDWVDYSDKSAAVSVALADAANASVTVGGIVEDIVRNIENVKGGSGNDKLLGDGLSNILEGGGGNDILDGVSGADTLIGGLGNDTYLNDGGDTIIEAANGGADLVRSSVTFTLGANLESLILTGAAAIDGTGNNLANVITGNAAANQLFGGEGNDNLRGGAGDDRLSGGPGDDTLDGGDGTDQARYVSSPAGVRVSLAIAGPQDTGAAGVDTLVRIENLLGSQFDDVLSGNSKANTLYGGDGNDILDGVSGADTLIGGHGSDTYLNDGGDTLIEAANGGTDLVRSSVTVALGANLENLILTGSAAINGTGNALANSLSGNAASNVLEGGDGNDILDGVNGADTLIGGRGNDTYLNDGDDTIIEAPNGGTDLVRSSVTFALGANLENLILTGAAAIDGTGNGLANVITGSAAANQLFGGEGNDILRGGAGDDSLSGGPGNDTLDGGDGTDQARYASSTAGVRVSLAIAGPQDTGAAGVDTLVRIENLLGSQFDDVLSGNSKANTLSGYGGNDMLTGGRGNDAFQFDTPLVAGAFTTITDFAAGGDKIALARAVFSEAGSLGPLSAGAFFIGSAAHDASDRVIYNSGTGALLYDADGTGGQGAMQFASVSQGLALSAGDFKIV